MQDILEVIILGIVQGLTEFLPVSSSGHLEIFRFILGDNALSEQDLLTTVVLHFATALATIFVFRKDIMILFFGALRKSGTDQRNFILKIIISMIPAVFVGLYFEDLIEQIFNQNLLLIGVCLIVTAILLFVSEKITGQSQSIKISQAFIIGLSQAFAILPGISRSGSTIATSLILGIEKAEAAKFSFLMVIPIIFGKIAKDILSGELALSSPNINYLAIGFFAAFVTGIWACTTMLKIVKATKLYWFGIYCMLAGIVVIITSLM